MSTTETKSVFSAEDNATFCEATRHVLNKFGMKVSIAEQSSFESVWTYLGRRCSPFQFVFLQVKIWLLMLPGIDALVEMDVGTKLNRKLWRSLFPGIAFSHAKMAILFYQSMFQQNNPIRDIFLPCYKDLKPTVYGPNITLRDVGDALALPEKYRALKVTEKCKGCVAEFYHRYTREADFIPPMVEDETKYHNLQLYGWNYRYNKGKAEVETKEIAECGHNKMKTLPSLDNICFICTKPSKEHCFYCLMPYCSTTCQSIDWKHKHKDVCKAMAYGAHIERLDIKFGGDQEKILAWFDTEEGKKILAWSGKKKDAFIGGK